jgi:hypothetical protein
MFTEIRENLATDFFLTLDRDLPEVRGYKVAQSQPMQQAVADYNKRAYEECLQRQLARLNK